MEYLVAILAGGGFTAIIEITKLLVARKEKKEKEHDILESIHRDGKRTQLLLLISDYPDRVDEIMEVAQKYFVDLNGNWYAHELFETWLDSRGMDKPNWYR